MTASISTRIGEPGPPGRLPEEPGGLPIGTGTPFPWGRAEAVVPFRMRRCGMRTLDELDDLRARLLDEVRSRPERVREEARAPGGGWTPSQVLQHLYLVESLLLSWLTGERARPPRPGARTVRHRLGGVVVYLVFRLGLRVRMPTRRVNPDPPLPFPELEARWPPVARDLRTRLEAARASAPREPVLNHPVAGPLDPDGAARFLLDHMRHHQRQLRRILDRVPDPEAPPEARPGGRHPRE
jgi:hypothetical protein